MSDDIKKDKMKKFMKNEIQDMNLAVLVSAATWGECKVVVWWDEDNNKFDWEVTE